MEVLTWITSRKEGASLLDGAQAAYEVLVLATLGHKKGCTCLPCRATRHIRQGLRAIIPEEKPTVVSCCTCDDPIEDPPQLCPMHGFKRV